MSYSNHSLAVDEYTEQFNDITLGILRNKYETRQNFHKAPQWVKQRYASGKFRRIKSRVEPTAIRLADGGIIGYRVPAELVDRGLAHVERLETWAEEFSSRLPKSEDPCRGLRCVRKYARWVKYNKGFVPKLSGDYRHDGQAACKFFESSELLWRRACELFPTHHNERVLRDLTQHSLNEGEERLCGPWMGCAVNIAVGAVPVKTRPHRDTQGFLSGMSCLCPFGTFTGGGLVLWELHAVVELKRGDLFFFMDHLINHSNEKAYGLRHSVVAFTEHRIWMWMERKHGFVDRRIGPFREAGKRFRQKGERRRVEKRLKLDIDN
jgi:hypothetical protein